MCVHNPRALSGNCRKASASIAAVEKRNFVREQRDIERAEAKRCREERKQQQQDENLARALMMEEMEHRHTNESKRLEETKRDKKLADKLQNEEVKTWKRKAKDLKKAWKAAASNVRISPDVDNNGVQLRVPLKHVDAESVEINMSDNNNKLTIEATADMMFGGRWYVPNVKRVSFKKVVKLCGGDAAGRVKVTHRVTDDELVVVVAGVSLSLNQ